MTPLNPNKLRLARLFSGTGLSSALLRLQASLLGPHVRILNYHDVPASSLPNFERQLELYKRHFLPVGPSELEELLAGRRRHRRPGLLLSFDDGVRTHFEAAPLLEKHGFTGWFLVPSAFPGVAVEEQAAYARRNRIWFSEADGGARVAMSWEEVRRLDRRHVIGCHTMHHRRLGAELTAEELELEIPRAKELMEEHLEREVPLFGWVGGEESSYSAAAAQEIRRAGFRLGFMTNNAVVRPGCDPLQLQRTNVEADYPLFLTRFQLCGMLDLMYLFKRRRVSRLTALNPST